MEYTTININSSDVKSFFSEQEKNDIWNRVYTPEIKTVPLEHNELNLMIPGAFAAEYTVNGTPIHISGFSEDVTEENIKSTMCSTKTAAILPVNGTPKLYPLRYTSFGHIQERSGITGNSISSLKDRKRAVEMNPSTRCEIFNKGLNLYKDKTLALIRDGKITALLSGDENDYSIMPVSRLINILENEIENIFSSYTLDYANVSYEVAEVMYTVHDEQLEKQLFQMLQANGYLPHNLTIKIRLTSSDVGKCAARITPLVYDGDILLPFGKSESVEHKGGSKAMSLFIDKSHLILARYRNNIQNIQNMMNIVIKNPVECLGNVYAYLKMTGYSQALNECKDRILAEHANTCSAFDIYWYLNEMLFVHEQNMKKLGKEVTLYNAIKAQETVAEVLFLNLTQFDYC